MKKFLVFLVAFNLSIAPVFANGPRGNADTPAIWLKANVEVEDSLGNSAVDDENIGTWQDQSGNDYDATQGVDDDRPSFEDSEEFLINFNPTIDFDGVSENFSLPITSLPIGNEGYTVFVVFESDSDDADHTFLSGGNEVENELFNLGQSENGALIDRWGGAGDDEFENFSEEAVIAADNAYLATFYYDPFALSSNRLIYVNGEDTTVDVGDNPGTDQLFHNGGVLNTSVGKRVAGNEFFNGRIAEIIVYTTDLDTDDRNLVESYLAIKYGITLNSTDNGATAGFDERDYHFADETVIWDYSTNNDVGFDLGFGLPDNFIYDIAGIAKDDDSELDQGVSRSTNADSILQVAPTMAPTLDDGDALIWANNNEDSTAWNEDDQLDRHWRFVQTGNIASTTITIDANDLPALPMGGLGYLLYTDTALAMDTPEIIEFVETETEDIYTAAFTPTVGAPGVTYVTLGYSSNTPPTASFTAQQINGSSSGEIELTITLDDGEDDDLKVKVEYDTDDACDGPWVAATMMDTTTATQGADPDVDNEEEYQIGTNIAVDTSAGENEITAIWDAREDLGGVDKAVCLQITANDGAEDTEDTEEVDVNSRTSRSGGGSSSSSGGGSSSSSTTTEEESTEEENETPSANEPAICSELEVSSRTVTANTENRTVTFTVSGGTLTADFLKLTFGEDELEYTQTLAEEVYTVTATLPLTVATETELSITDRAGECDSWNYSDFFSPTGEVVNAEEKALEELMETCEEHFSDFATLPNKMVSCALWEREVMVGTRVEGSEQYAFEASRPINRAEFLKVLFVNANFDEIVGTPEALPLTDLKESDWFYKFVEYGYRKGLVKGYPDKTFGASNTINYAEAIALAVRLEELLSGTSKTTEGAAEDPWFKKYLDVAVADGLVEAGIEPGALLTRAKAAELIQKIYEVYYAS